MSITYRLIRALPRDSSARALVPLVIVHLLAGCSTLPGVSEKPSATTHIPDAASRCARLANTSVPAAVIALPTSGARIVSASLQPADAKSGTPEYCKVMGAVQAANSADPPISFQLNLPSAWNTKAVQYGGGGFNGVVITGLTEVRHAPPGAKTPLALGYSTFGSDSGHSGPGGGFGLNAQAFANYAGESVKRTRDAAIHLIAQYYQRSVSRTYYQGGSKGGHEGLIAAQRYASDYDGVLAYYPASQNLPLVMTWYRSSVAAYANPAAALNPAKQALLRAKVLQACDALDGVADGIVADLNGCRRAFGINSLRCPGGTDTGDGCLSDAQIHALLVAASPMELPFPLANGVRSAGGYPVFEGGDIAGILHDANGVDVTRTGYYGFYDGVIRFWYLKDGKASSANFNFLAAQARLEEISALYDASSANLDAFRAKGGKLLMVQGTTDMLVSHAMTTAYYESLAARYGQQTRGFVRYFVQPGFAHGRGVFNGTWDALEALDTWVEGGQPPTNPVMLDANEATRGRTRPLCEYPSFPKYKGSGNVNDASSFACEVR